MWRYFTTNQKEMSNLEEAVFGGNTTLWNVLDTENISNINVELARLEEQVQTLGRTVSNNYDVTNDRITTLNTSVNSIETEVGVLQSQIGLIPELQAEVAMLAAEVALVDPEAIQDQFDAMDARITALNVKLDSYITTTNSQLQSVVNSLTVINNRLSALEANTTRFTVLTIGNEYVWAFRAGTIGYTRRVTFNGIQGTVISANTTYNATILDSQSGTQYTTPIRLVATNDTFRNVGYVAYPILLGTCYMSRSGDTGEGPTGYMTVA